jgi:hypothetical protein
MLPILSLKVASLKGFAMNPSQAPSSSITHKYSESLFAPGILSLMSSNTNARKLDQISADVVA